VRQQLVGPLAFYRGVCQANLGEAEKARGSFQAFLAVQPNASIDPGTYSKKAVAAFEEARKASAAPESVSGGSSSLFTAYQEFKPPANVGDPPNEKWAEGPVQWILTPEEKKAWSELASGAERAEFVEKFWQARNPNPGGAENIYRTGFERRAAFADAQFVQDEKKRGSLTDRGMVFVLLGPPTYGGRKPIMAGEDPTDRDGMFTEDKTIVSGATRNSVHLDGSRATDATGDFREIWHYRREDLPKAVSHPQVDVVFITRKGYGRQALQRDLATQAALEAARPRPAHALRGRAAGVESRPGGPS
jgi:GWxTD domain-containing protein